MLKRSGIFDGLDLLAITGRHQIGRVEYNAPPVANIDPSNIYNSGGRRFSSVDDVLRARRDGGLFDYLMQRYGERSGISGVQPKVLIQDVAQFSEAQKFSSRQLLLNGQATERATVTLNAATHIIKLWDKAGFAELAANEYFCLKAAQKAGLDVPEFTLSDSGEALIIERFDLTLDQTGQGVYRGFEDFCVLNGVNADEKYRGSYEAKLFRRMTDYVEPAKAHVDLRRLFQLFVLNVILRNGDAHLKNFGMIYDRLDGPVRLAPAYDILTTTAYLPNDMMALTLEGSTRWPDRKRIDRLGQRYCGLRPSDIRAIIDKTISAVVDTRADMAYYFKNCPTPELALKILNAWEIGVENIKSSN